MKIFIRNKIKTVAAMVMTTVAANCFSQVNSQEYLELADSADSYIAQELWDKAEKTLVKALRLEPANFHNSLLLSNLGIVQMRKEEYDKALESFNLALAIAPSSSVIYNNRASVLLLKEDTGAAKDDLLRSLEIDPGQEWPLQTLALIYLSSYEDDEARNRLSKLRNLFPENPVAYSGLATLATRNGDTEEALQLYRKSLEIKPDDPETLSAYIYLLIETDRYSEARGILRKAIEEYPEYAMFYLLRGYLHRLNYRSQEAEADKKTAIQKGLDAEYVKSFIP